MLKLQPPDTHNMGHTFHKFKCGEIYCLNPNTYNVACCLCGNKVAFDLFPEHFQQEHLAHNAELEEEFKPEVDPIKSENEESTYIEDDDDEKPIDLFPPRPTESEEIKPAIAIADQETDSPTRKLRSAEVTKKEPEEQQDATSEPELEPAGDSDWQMDKFSDDDDDDFNEKDDPSFRDSDKGQEDLPFACSECKRAYKTKRSLQNHFRQVHNPERKPRQPSKKHKCEVCGEMLHSARNLRGHMWKHTGIVCDVCGKTFTQVGNLARHKIRHTGIKAHKCQECGNDFFTDKELKAHMLRHTGERPIICEVCGRPCRDHGVLTAHMRRHTGERPAKCDVCGKSFYSFHDLNVHAVTHSSERPFACDVCGSTFQRKKSLRVHKKLHSKVRNHECKVCGKTFAQSGGLNAHMRTHDAALTRSIVPNTNVTVAVPSEGQGPSVSAAGVSVCVALPIDDSSPLLEVAKQ